MFLIVILLKSNSINWQIQYGCCGWALPRSCVVLLFDLRRNANLAGGFAGRFVDGLFRDSWLN